MRSTLSHFEFLPRQRWRPCGGGRTWRCGENGVSVQILTKFRSGCRVPGHCEKCLPHRRRLGLRLRLIAPAAARVARRNGWSSNRIPDQADSARLAPGAEKSKRGGAEAAEGGAERLASGFWLLASGFWLLASGFWLLASGFWLLASARHAETVGERGICQDLHTDPSFPACPVRRGERGESSVPTSILKISAA
jgi:hypothetical protein